MSDFTFAQGAAILGITPSAFSYRMRKPGSNVPFAQGPRYNERRVSLEDLERISGRAFTTREIEYALTIKAPNWKRQQVKRDETFAEYAARRMNAVRAKHPGKTDEEIKYFLVDCIYSLAGSDHARAK